MTDNIGVAGTQDTLKNPELEPTTDTKTTNQAGEHQNVSNALEKDRQKVNGERKDKNLNFTDQKGETQYNLITQLREAAHKAMQAVLDNTEAIDKKNVML